MTFSETDFTEDLKMLHVPTLKIYADAPHGLAARPKGRLDADLRAFLKT